MARSVTGAPADDGNESLTSCAPSTRRTLAAVLFSSCILVAKVDFTLMQTSTFSLSNLFTDRVKLQRSLSKLLFETDRGDSFEGLFCFCFLSTVPTATLSATCVSPSMISKPTLSQQRFEEAGEFQTTSSHHLLSLNREGRWGTTDYFAVSFLHIFLFSTALWDLVNSRPVHSLMLSSYLFLCLPCLLSPFTVPCKMVLARPDDRKT